MDYYLLYKPYGMLSQFTREHPGQTTLADLDFDFPKDVYPVGRLDADSEGLLLLTNEKAAVKRLLDPKSHVAKTYLAQVEGIPMKEAVEKLQNGVIIKVKKKPFRTRPAQVRLLAESPQLPDRNPPIRYRKNIPDSWLEITLTEGKNRQVRKMCAAVGFPVLRLVRIAFGKWKLGKGDLKELTPGQVVKV
ncbi:MAG: pseudouridine synthase [Saprospirales bacterium]|nr:pseudouridine synthase [Saprospirales bacterium]